MAHAFDRFAAGCGIISDSGLNRTLKEGANMFSWSFIRSPVSGYDKSTALIHSCNPVVYVNLALAIYVISLTDAIATPSASSHIGPATLDAGCALGGGGAAGHYRQHERPSMNIGVEDQAPSSSTFIADLREGCSEHCDRSTWVWLRCSGFSRLLRM